MRMTEEDHVYENAMAERMNGILKEEFGLDARFNTFKEAKKAVKESISIYNNERLHLALNYKTPGEVHRNRCPVF
jgi:transposase InsO family protein